MKKLLYTTVLALIIMSTACGKNEEKCKYLDEAVQQGGAAAWTLGHCDLSDTFAVQRIIIEIRSQRSRFVMLGDTVAANAFDKAFHDSLNNLNPVLCKTIFDVPK